MYERYPNARRRFLRCRPLPSSKYFHDAVTRRDYDCVGVFHEGVPTVLIIHSPDCFSLWTAAYTRRSRKAF